MEYKNLTYDNTILPGDLLRCIKTSPCGSVTERFEYFAASQVFSQGYGPEVDIKAFVGDNMEYKVISMSVKYFSTISEYRSNQISKILDEG
jgi:hypothetical protein